MSKHEVTIVGEREIVGRTYLAMLCQHTRRDLAILLDELEDGIFRYLWS